jgi:hypothetical protein
MGADLRRLNLRGARPQRRIVLFAADLALTREEAAALLRAAGVMLGEDDVASRTAGPKDGRPRRAPEPPIYG